MIWRRRDGVDVVRAFGDELSVDFQQSVDGNGNLLATHGNDGILAEDAAETADCSIRRGIAKICQRKNSIDTSMKSYYHKSMISYLEASE